MNKRNFTVEALWDAEAQVCCCKSAIIGLHVESGSIEEFENMMMSEGIKLIIANHMTPEELAAKPMRDLLPAIIWKRPEALPAAA
jgi:hypothetical protein